MGDMFGLAAFGFWMFVAAAAVGGIWDGVRKREAEHETLRRLIESGNEPDAELIDKLLGHKEERSGDLKVAGIIVLFASVGLAILGYALSFRSADAFMPLLGVSGLVACIGIGLLVAARVSDRSKSKDAANDSNRELFR